MSRVIFAGTPRFACESLRALTGSEFKPVAVLTQPDRPAGRGKKLQASPVKTFARACGINVLQSMSLRGAEIQSELEALQPDVLVVAAYGLLLPQAVLDLPNVACVNVHASLLPRWRGAAPVQAAILAGDRQTGISLMQMEAGLDTGPVYATAALDIGVDETAGELLDRLATLGGTTLVQHLPAILAGRAQAVPQDDRQATYAGKVRTADAELDWLRPAAELQRVVRAYNPLPGAWTTAGSERLKCWRAELGEGIAAAPGTVTSAGPDGIDVATGDGTLRLCELQRPGKNRVTAAQLASQVELQDRVLGQQS